jgi:ketosteroid isomerase-like protein
LETGHGRRVIRADGGRAARKGGGRRVLPDSLETITFQEFQPKEFIAQDETVVALGTYAGTPTAGGPQFRSPWAMVFTFREGKVIEFREYTDSAALNASFQGAAARV